MPMPFFFSIRLGIILFPDTPTLRHPYATPDIFWVCVFTLPHFQGGMWIWAFVFSMFIYTYVQLFFTIDTTNICLVNCNFDVYPFEMILLSYRHSASIFAEPVTICCSLTEERLHGGYIERFILYWSRSRTECLLKLSDCLYQVSRPII